MHKKTSTAAPQVDPMALPHCDSGDVAEWLTNIEQAFDADEDDVRREYTNIGGQNGLELFV